MILTAEFKKPKARGSDSCGSGAYGASRGRRKHRGIDYNVSAGEYVATSIAGTVTRFGLPYSNPKKADYRYVEITDSKGYQHRYFYVEPLKSLSLGDCIDENQIIGKCQDIAKTCSGMSNHVHYEIKKGGKYVDPKEYISNA